MAVNTHAFYSNKSDRWLRAVATGSLASELSIKGLSTFTWEAWVKCKPEWNSQDNQLNKTILWYESKPDRPNVDNYSLPRFMVSVTNTHLRFSLSVLDFDGVTNYTYPYDFVDKWTHIAFAVDTGAQEYEIIINGTSVQTGTIVGGGIDVDDEVIAVADTAPSIVSVMRGYLKGVGTSGSLWNGGLESPRLWNTKKGASAILSGMNDFFTISAPNLLYQFDMDDVNSSGQINAVRSASIAGNPYLSLYDTNGITSVANKTTDRPFLGNGSADTTAPSVPIMKAHTNIGPTGFTLSWNASTDNVSVQNYIVDVATDSGFNNLVQNWTSRNVGRALTITFEDGAPNSVFYARVRAVDAAGNASGWSSYSGNAPIVTQSNADYTAPSVPPQNVRVTGITSSSFSIEWERGATVNEVAGYKVHVGLSPNFSTMVPVYRNLDVGLVREFTFDTDLLPLTAYWVRVRSYDQNANESWDSNIVQVVTQALPDITPPETVQMDTPTAVEATRFTLRWLPTTDNVGVQGYLVDIAYDAEFEQLVEGYRSKDVGNVLRAPISGLEELRTYFARVRAYDQAGNISEPEEPQAITTSALTSSEDGYIEVGSVSERFEYQGSMFPEEGVANPETFEVTTTKNLKMIFSPVTALGEPSNLEMFLWIEELVGEDVRLEVRDGSTLVGWVEPQSSESWASVQIASTPTNLLQGCTLDLSMLSDTVGAKAVIGSGLTNDNPSPSLSFNVNTEQVTKPIESDLSLDFVTARNFIPNPDFLHPTKRDVGHTRSSGVTDDFVTDTNWDVLVRRTSMSNGGDIYFYSETITDSTNKLQVHEPLRGALYMGILNNNGTKEPANFQVTLGVEYTDATQNVTVRNFEVVDGLHPYFVNSLNINQAKTVSRVYLRITTMGAYNGTFATYMPTIYQAPEQMYPFSGNTYAAGWEEELNFGTSSLSYPRISGQLSYIGDSDNTGSARLSLLSRDVGLTTYSWYGTGLATKDHESKIFSATAKTQFILNQLGNGSFDILENTNWYPSLLGVGHTIDLEFGGKNLDGDISRSGFRHLNVVLAEKDAGSSDLDFGVGNSQVIAKHAINGSSFKAYVRGKAGADVKITFSSSSSSSVTTLHTHTLVSDAWEEVKFDIPLDAVSYSGFIRIHMNTADFATGDKYSIDGVQLGASIPFFADETFNGAYSLGGYGKSPVVAFLPYNGVQDAVWLVDDPDGVDSEMRLGLTGIVGDSIRIEGAPDSILTVKDLRATITENSLFVTFEYDGDDGQTADLDLRWKRTDHTEERAWNRVPVSWNRSAKIATALITDLTPRTSYTVVAEASDKLLPTYGENPIERVFTTSAQRQKAITTPKILFGGYVLQDNNTKGIWVDRHDAFNHPERNLKVDKLPRYQGSVEISDWWEKKVITMSGGISGKTRQELAENLNSLRLALSKRQQNLVIDTLDERSFYFTATCTSFDIPEEAGVNFRHLKWSATFTCADPFRYAGKEDVEEGLTLMNGETVVIPNLGDLEISPKFYVSTTSPTNIEFTLINSSTGQRITPVTKIKNGDNLQILSDQLKVTKNGVPIDFSGSFPHLDVGNNTIQVETFPISYPITLTVRRRHKFF